MNPKEKQIADKLLDAALASTDSQEQSVNIMLYGNIIGAYEFRVRAEQEEK